MHSPKGIPNRMMETVVQESIDGRDGDDEY
jgi:hypothetical protein